MDYKIYHPKDGRLNTECEIGKYQYEHVATVDAVGLNSAFMRSQNDFNDKYAKLGLRSTSVGDCIGYGDKVYMVMGKGFKEIMMSFLQLKPNQT